MIKIENFYGKSKTKLVDKYTKTIKKLENKLEKEFAKVKLNKKNPSEVIVVFEEYSKRRSCLKDYSKYSNWYSNPRKMENQYKLNKEYGFKVTEAPETFEYQIENM